MDCVVGAKTQRVHVSNSWVFGLCGNTSLDEEMLAKYTMIQCLDPQGNMKHLAQVLGVYYTAQMHRL